jgi:hypothetical protein
MRRLWVLGAVFVLLLFQPGIDTPLYFYMTDHMQFSQGLIGALNSSGRSAGSLRQRFMVVLGDLNAKSAVNLTSL